VVATIDPDVMKAPKLDLSLCAACQHPKHVGRRCDQSGEVDRRDGRGLVIEICTCDDARARKDDRRKQGGWHLLPWTVIGYVADIYDYGSRKYAANSWQNLPPDPETHATAKERYEQAMFRHWGAYKKGEWLDPESGKPHLAHFIWGALAVMWFELKERSETKEQP
jgi:hypothetical protein